MYTRSNISAPVDRMSGRGLLDDTPHNQPDSERDNKEGRKIIAEPSGSLDSGRRFIYQVLVLVLPHATRKNPLVPPIS
jgi:hypothetical protein